MLWDHSSHSKELVDVFTDQSRARPGGNKTSSFGFSTHTKLGDIAGDEENRLQAEATQDPARAGGHNEQSSQSWTISKRWCHRCCHGFPGRMGRGQVWDGSPIPSSTLHYWKLRSLAMVGKFDNQDVDKCSRWQGQNIASGRNRVTMLFLPNKEKRHCRSEMFFTELGYFIAWDKGSI